MPEQKPSYNITNVFNLRRRITADLKICELVGIELVKEQFEALCDVLQELLPKGVHRQVIVESVMDLAGSTLTIESLDMLAWRLAGNVRRLRGGYPVPPWTHQSEDEWVPAQCTATQIATDRFNKQVVQVTFRILAGTSAALFARDEWSRKFCHYVGRKIGFSKATGTNPMKQVSELVSCRLLLKISADKGTKQLIPGEISPYAGGLTWNEKLFSRRRRTKQSGFTCPKNYATLPCYKCEVGYQDCPASVHRFTYYLDHCDNCDKEDWFNPELKMNVCVNCYNYLTAKGKT